uniref:Uncharacterized protein n=1 Tax=Vespula pensylvanica TaxID=30213 RepID=A0A834PDQ3_VESPE|nr:hypothetical protein H0235_000046 [Vespula pensylvanica]
MSLSRIVRVKSKYFRGRAASSGAYGLESLKREIDLDRAPFNTIRKIQLERRPVTRSMSHVHFQVEHFSPYSRTTTQSFFSVDEKRQRWRYHHPVDFTLHGDETFQRKNFPNEEKRASQECGHVTRIPDVEKTPRKSRLPWNNDGILNDRLPSRRTYVAASVKIKASSRATRLRSFDRKYVSASRFKRDRTFQGLLRKSGRGVSEEVEGEIFASTKASIVASARSSRIVVTGSDRLRARFARDKPASRWRGCRSSFLLSIESPTGMFCKSQSRFRNCSAVPESAPTREPAILLLGPGNDDSEDEDDDNAVAEITSGIAHVSTRERRGSGSPRNLYRFFPTLPSPLLTNNLAHERDFFEAGKTIDSSFSKSNRWEGRERAIS